MVNGGLMVNGLLRAAGGKAVPSLRGRVQPIADDLIET
jgi:hypothetical protein